jgi:hypothetical protein
MHAGGMTAALETSDIVSRRLRMESSSNASGMVAATALLLLVLLLVVLSSNGAFQPQDGITIGIGR